MAIKLTMDQAMISEAMAEWEREHPGRKAIEMTPAEFGDRMMAKIAGSVEIVTETPPHPTRQ